MSHKWTLSVLLLMSHAHAFDLTEKVDELTDANSTMSCSEECVDADFELNVQSKDVTEQDGEISKKSKSPRRKSQAAMKIASRARKDGFKVDSKNAKALIESEYDWAFDKKLSPQREELVLEKLKLQHAQALEKIIKDPKTKKIPKESDVRLAKIRIEDVSVDTSDITDARVKNLIRKRLLDEVRGQMTQSLDCMPLENENPEKLTIRCIGASFNQEVVNKNYRTITLKIPSLVERENGKGNPYACPGGWGVTMRPGLRDKVIQIPYKDKITKSLKVDGQAVPEQVALDIKQKSINEINQKLARLHELEMRTERDKEVANGLSVQITQSDKTIEQSNEILVKQQQEKENINNNPKLHELEVQKTPIDNAITQRENRIDVINNRLPNLDKIGVELEQKMDHVYEESIFQRTEDSEMLFAIDGSGSIDSDYCRPYPNCLEYAVRQLSFTLGQLKPNQKFNVAFFHADVSAFAKSPVQATPENIRNAQNFLSDLYDLDKRKKEYWADFEKTSQAEKAAFNDKQVKQQDALEKKIEVTTKADKEKLEKLKKAEESAYKAAEAAKQTPEQLHALKEASDKKIKELENVIAEKEEKIRKPGMEKLALDKAAFDDKMVKSKKLADENSPKRAAEQVVFDLTKKLDQAKANKASESEIKDLEDQINSMRVGSYGGYGYPGKYSDDEQISATIDYLSTNDLKRVYILTDGEFSRDETIGVISRVSNSQYGVTIKPLASPDMGALKQMTPKSKDMLLSRQTTDSIKDFEKLKKEFDGLKQEKVDLPKELATLKQELPAYQKSQIELQQKIQLLISQQEFDLQDLQKRTDLTKSERDKAIAEKSKQVTELKRVQTEMEGMTEEANRIRSELKALE